MLGTQFFVILIMILRDGHVQVAVYRTEQGAAEQEEDRMKRQYEANVKDPNGKELLLLLDAVVRELSYRTQHNMLQIELESVDLHLLDRLLLDVRDLMPTAAADDEADAENLNETQPPPDDGAKQIDTIDVPGNGGSSGV